MIDFNAGLRLRFLCVLYVLVIAVVPIAVIFVLAIKYKTTLLLAPVIYSLIYVVVSGSLSKLHARGVVEGKHRRDSENPIYFHRTLYNLCWTSVYYFKPIYWLFLSFQPLKLCMFRIFGYKGPVSFTVYPDTWIRDLPLLYFGEGSYISNRATLGSNIIVDSNTVRIGKIELGKNAMIGHLAVVGLGLKMGEDSEIGVRAITGVEVTLGQSAIVGAASNIGHYVKIGKNARIGESSYVATRTTVDSGAEIPSGYNPWVEKLLLEIAPNKK